MEVNLWHQVLTNLESNVKLVYKLHLIANFVVFPYLRKPFSCTFLKFFQLIFYILSNKYFNCAVICTYTGSFKKYYLKNMLKYRKK